MLRRCRVSWSETRRRNAQRDAAVDRFDDLRKRIDGGAAGVLAAGGPGGLGLAPRHRHLQGAVHGRGCGRRRTALHLGTTGASAPSARAASSACWNCCGVIQQVGAPTVKHLTPARVRRREDRRTSPVGPLLAGWARSRPKAARKPCQSGARPLMRLSKAAIAQSVEHIIRNDGVGGSNPSCGTST